MGVEGFSGGDDDRVARQAIEQADLILRGTAGEVPEGFVGALFGRVVPEDVAALEPRDLAALARATWSRLAARRPGEPAIAVADSEVASGGRLARLSVIEIVNDDMPFLVDSVMAELGEHELNVRLIAHPIVFVERDPAGRLVGWSAEPGAPAARRESLIHIHVDRIGDPGRAAAIAAGLAEVMAEVRVCVADWKPMQARVAALVAGLKEGAAPLPPEEVAEATAFLDWLAADNFTFLGVRDYRVDGPDGGMEPVADSGLGTLRAAGVKILHRGGAPVPMTPAIREYLSRPVPLVVSKSNGRSRVHRRVPMDYIGIKRFDAEGRLVGETRVVGLFTSTAYTRSTRTIPWLRRKVDRVLARAGFDPAGHSGKALVNVLETYPRDELFQIDEETLFRFAIAILRLGERPRLRVLARRDEFERFASVIVYVPRDHYDSEVRARIGDFLARTFGGRVSAWFPFFPEGPLVRVHFIIGCEAGAPPPDPRALEAGIDGIVRRFEDVLAEALNVVHDPSTARTLLARWGAGLSAAYRESYDVATAVGDIRVLESLGPDRPLAIDFFLRPASPDEEPEGPRIGVKVWSLDRPIPLSERVPALEAMGFRVVEESSLRLAPEGRVDVYLHDMTLVPRDLTVAGLGALGPRLEEAFAAVLGGEAESDGFNALVLAAGLPWRDVALVRAVARWLRQAPVTFSQDYMAATLVRHPAIASRIVALFQARFDPRGEPAPEVRATAEAAIRAEIAQALDAVQSLDEDRILRRFVEVVGRAVRTNFYQADPGGRPKPTIALKIPSREIEGLPLPRPLYEIFVYSPRVEGVHLRFGKVARGGLRWSDRPQDFRTEVLGLVKAQQVKNAVIVPVGAKGGFVPKRLPPPGDRAAWLAEGTEAYRIFVGALLDLTDDLDGEAVVPPEGLVRHDADDPYLVVAADKGTATFSDTANAISEARGFWLGDAFASGGSAGYDHKRMGITARGAWEAVKRHFREIDVDIQTTPFTAAGVGDMSGDVFGNGMLLSPATKLVAAFDHRDIFLDPTPDPARSHAERVRLFALPRSSWQDYDRTLISEGGGIFPRSAKVIPLSPQARAVLGFDRPEATPAEVMSAILKAPVDLLWFGGIGTYVRASLETDAGVGDKANDAIRVTGAELRARVIGEGANLGMTQRGRIEAARRGVRLNTDAIDNSAGVNTSDVEVNIKIALSTPEREGRLDRTSRNALLAAMTDDVAALVLRNNYLQTLALSLAARRGAEDLGFLQRMMQSLEARGQLDRGVEFLPDDREIEERRRRGEGLTRPELAVLLAYGKISLYDTLVASPVPDDPYLGRELDRYFPAALRERFPEAVAGHRLRREIIATALSNSMINRGGPAFVSRIADQTGATAPEIAAGFAAVRGAFGLIELNGAIDALDGKVPGAVQLGMYAAVQDLLLDRIVWLIRNVDLMGRLEAVIAHYREGVAEVAAALGDVLPPQAAADLAERARAMVADGVPADLASRIASLPVLVAATDIVLVADRTGRPVRDVAATWFATGAWFEFDRVIAAARDIRVTDYFDRLAVDRSLDAITSAGRRLAGEMLANGASPGLPAVEAWAEARGAAALRVRANVQDIAASGLTPSKLAVAASLIGDLART